MVLEAVSCKHCGQTQHVKRYGTTRAGTQRYRCFDCRRTARRPGFVQTYTHKARDPLVKEQITATADRSDGPQWSRHTGYRPYPGR
ncbi:transposase-like zinc-binding domain-containing protein [Spirosoma pollinicola]